MKRRLTLLALVLALLISGAGVAWYGMAVRNDARDNAAIRNLAAGRGAQLREGADARAVHAAILFFAWRERLEEAQELLPLMQDARPDLLADAWFAIGNARMRLGFENIETSRFEDAEPEIELAKQAYRSALQADPSDRDSKVNLDLAMRLVRDLPRGEADGNEDPENQPRRLWTDLPGLPRGAP